MYAPPTGENVSAGLREVMCALHVVLHRGASLVRRVFFVNACLRFLNSITTGKRPPSLAGSQGSHRLECTTTNAITQQFFIILKNGDPRQVGPGGPQKQRVFFPLEAYCTVSFHENTHSTAPAHHTMRSRIIRTTPTSSSSTDDSAPRRGWCPMQNASPLRVSFAQLRPLATEKTAFPTMMVWRCAPVDASHTRQLPSRLPEASLLPSTWLRF